MMQPSHALDSTLNVEHIVTLRWLNLGLKPGLGPNTELTVMDSCSADAGLVTVQVW